MSLRAPLVTIGMPVYNCEATISEAIASVLSQTFNDWALIVYDDGSLDASVPMARRFNDPRIQIVKGDQNRGLPSCLNKIAARVETRYFARMDADDVMYPNRLAKQVAYLDEHPDVDLLGGGMLIFLGDGAAMGGRTPPIEHGAICKRPWATFLIAHPTWMGRIEWFRQNPYREHALRMEDKELLFRTFQSSRFANLPDIVLGYREESLSAAKIFLARKNFCSVLVKGAGHQISCFQASCGLVGQAVQMGIDIIAIRTGLKETILRHRARPLSTEVLEHWNAVWASTVRAAKVGEIDG